VRNATPKAFASKMTRLRQGYGVAGEWEFWN
jgi:hypothetical protein